MEVSKLDYFWSKDEEKLKLKCMTDSGIKTIDANYDPYFFVKKDDKNKLKRLRKTLKHTQISDDKAKTVIGNHRVLTLMCSSPYQMRQIAERLRGHGIDTYEDDISYKDRWMVDNAVQPPTFKAKNLLSFDIEVDARKEFPKWENPYQRIISIGCVDGHNKRIFLCDDDERKMLNDFCKLSRRYHIVTGWNIDDFDIPYMNARAKLLGVTMNYGLCSFIDGMSLYSSSGYGYGYSLRLDDTINRELGHRIKEQHFDTLNRMQELWDSFVGDRSKLEGYCMDDTASVKDLMIKEELKLMDIAVEKARVAYTHLDNVTKMSKLVEALKLKYEHERPERRVFNRKEWVEDEPNLAGGYVFTPVADLHKWVAIIDFSGMYSRIMRMFNVDIETLAPYNALDSEVYTAPNGVKFYKEPKSANHNIMTMLEEQKLANRKLQWQYDEHSDEHKLYFIRSVAYKLLGLSFYGVLGSPFSRFFDINIANAITAWGRQYIQGSAEVARRLGYTTVYGDSVTGDTVIPIKNSENEIHLVSIENMLNKYSFEKIEQDDKMRYAPTEDIYTLSHNFDTDEAEWKKITQLIKHKNNKTVHTVRTPRSIFSVTEDHSIFDENGELFSTKEYTNKEKFVSARKPKLTKTKLHFTNKIKTIDVVNFLNDELNHYKNSLRKTEVKVLDDAIKLEWKYLDTKTNNTLNRVGHTYKCITLPRFIRLDSHFGYILGFYAADGSTTNIGKTGGRITSTSQDNVDRFEEHFKYVFGDNYTKVNGRLSFGNHLISSIFSKLCGHSAEHKQLPDFILDTNEEFFLYFMQGYSYGDSRKVVRYENVHKIKTYMEAGSKSRKLISQIAFIMKNVYDLEDYNFIFKYRHGKQFYSISWDADMHMHRKYVNKCSHKALVRKHKVDADYVYDVSVEDNNNFVDALGMTVLHNTDSIMVALHKSGDDAVKEMEWLAEEINKHLCASTIKKYNMDPSDYIMEIEGERLFSRFYVARKKRYIGEVYFPKDKKGEIYSKGMELIKSGVFELLRNTQEEMFKLLFNSKDMNEANVKINKLFKQIKTNLYSGDVDDKLVMKRGVRQALDEYEVDGPHVRAAKKLAKLGLFREGDIVNYVVTDNNKGKVVVDPVIENEIPKIQPAGYYYYYDRLQQMRRKVFGVTMKRDLFSTLRIEKR